MKTNEIGLHLIACFQDEYDPAESRSAAEKIVSKLVKARLTSNQFSALVCFVMSIGEDTFTNSRMLYLLNKKELTKAADQFALYTYDYDDNGKRAIDPFLVEQRVFEQSLFLMPELVRKQKRRKKKSVCRE